MDVLLIPFQPDEPADVSVVGVNYNAGHLLDQMFAALTAARGSLHLQVIIVDNASRDDSARDLKRDLLQVEGQVRRTRGV
jgi:GT2 family glycosyltransferase